MNVTHSVLIAALGAGLLAGCGKSSKDAGQVIQQPELMTTWGAGCSKIDVPPFPKVSAKAFYRFAGKDLDQDFVVYSDNACSKPEVRIRRTGTFELKGDDPRAAGAKAIDLNYRMLTMTALDADGQKLLQRLHFCGHDDWAIDQKIDLTNAAGGFTCPLPKTPRDEYDIFHVHGDTLQLGEGPALGKPDRAANRPAKLDDQNKYFKTDHKWD